MNKSDTKGSATADAGPHREEVQDLLQKVFEQKMLPKDAFGLPDDVIEGIYGQAYLFYNSGRYKEASQIFNLLIMMNPPEPKYTMGLAACQQMMKDYSNAAVTYQLCAMMDLDNPLPHYYASDCFLKMEDKPSALLSLQIAHRIAEANSKYNVVRDRCKMALETFME